MTQEIAVRESGRLDELARLGQWLALSESGQTDEKARGAAAALRLYYAAELGLPPLAAAELSVISGRLVVSAQLLRALAANAGYRVLRYAGSNDTTCTAQLVNGDGKVVGEATFTIEDAQRAGLIRDRSAWKTHPARMLWARASANVIKDFAPAVALGLYTQDEAQEIQAASSVDTPRPAAEEAAWEPVDEDTEIEWPTLDATQEAEALEQLADMQDDPAG